MDDAMIQTAVSRGSLGSGGMPPAQNVVLAVANTLGVRYQDGWIYALSGTTHCVTAARAAGPSIRASLCCQQDFGIGLHANAVFATCSR